MGFLLECPNCGLRDYHEFWFGGEYHPFPKHPEDEGADTNFERVWLKHNGRGVQAERWFHFAGCRRWQTLERDTRSNMVDRIELGVGWSSHPTPPESDVHR
jgi:heterotetrameric sarcosine oxidase delta subunit